jgi:hypothetical protein
LQLDFPAEADAAASAKKVCSTPSLLASPSPARLPALTRVARARGPLAAPFRGALFPPLFCMRMRVRVSCVQLASALEPFYLGARSGFKVVVARGTATDELTLAAESAGSAWFVTALREAHDVLVGEVALAGVVLVQWATAVVQLCRAFALFPPFVCWCCVWWCCGRCCACALQELAAAKDASAPKPTTVTEAVALVGSVPHPSAHPSGAEALAMASVVHTLAGQALLPATLVPPAAAPLAAPVATSAVVKLRGLPWQASTKDIEAFFAPKGFTPKRVVMSLTPAGRPSGHAFAEFASVEEATTALELNREILGGRYIEVFPSTPVRCCVIAARATWCGVRTCLRAPVQSFTCSGWLGEARCAWCVVRGGAACGGGFSRRTCTLV